LLCPGVGDACVKSPFDEGTWGRREARRSLVGREEAPEYG
jgi:hypothetical protein